MKQIVKSEIQGIFLNAHLGKLNSVFALYQDYDANWFTNSGINYHKWLLVT